MMRLPAVLARSHLLVFVLASLAAVSASADDDVDLLARNAERVDASGAIHLDLEEPAASVAWTRNVRPRVIDVEVPPGLVRDALSACAGRGALGRSRLGSASRVDLTVRSAEGGRFTVTHAEQRVTVVRLPPGRHRHRFVLKGGELASNGLMRVRGPAGFSLEGLTVGATTCDSIHPPSSPELRGQRAVLPPKTSLRWVVETSPGDRVRVRARSDSGGRLAVRTWSDDAAPSTTWVRLSGAGERAVDVVLPRHGVQHVEVAVAAGTVELPEVRLVHPSDRAATVPPVRNVVILLIDTLRADRWLPSGSGARVQTPALDAAVSSGGIVFTSAFAQANWTKPSVATLLTGLMPWQHEATTHRAVVSPSVPFVTEHLTRAGIHTAAFIANGYISSRFGLVRGFDHLEHSEVTGRGRGREQVGALFRWLDSRDGRRARDRFFAYVHTTDVHAPYDPPPSMISDYDPRPYAGPITFDDDPLLLRRIETGELRPSPRDRDRLVALYDAGVAAHDDVVARLFRGLGRRGLMDDTMVVVLADHGEELFERGSVGHGGDRMWDEQLHIPLYVWWPGFDHGWIDEPVGIVDLPPTILSALDLDPPDWLAGRSLASIVGGGGRLPDAVVAAGARGATAVVSREHKMHWNGALGGAVRVYARADSVERRDVAAQRPLTVRHLRESLAAIRSRAHPIAAAEQPPVDPEMAARLRALGYVE